jgi:DNA polymerase III sliding clamp (beta) subunit (PCNA family)
MNTIQLPLTALDAVALFAAKGDVRDYLNGVLVDCLEQQVRLVATDGHVLGAWWAAVPCIPQRVILSNASIKAIQTLARAQWKPRERRSAFIGLNLASGDAQRRGASSGAAIEAVVGNQILTGLKPVAGRFPDYERVIPRHTDGEAGQYDPANLERFRQAAVLFGATHGQDTAHIAVHHNGAQGAALVELSSADAFVGVVMPMRTAPRSVADLTAFLRAPLARAA